MTAKNFLTREFEANRARLEQVAYRMLGSRSEAQDAVQEVWLRLQRADAAAIGNIGGWLTTVVGRLCLDMLRTRKSRREEPLEDLPGEAIDLEASMASTGGRNRHGGFGRDRDAGGAGDADSGRARRLRAA